MARARKNAKRARNRPAKRRAAAAQRSNNWTLGIGILAGILLPALAKAKEKAHRITCVSNLKQVGVAIQMYADENENTLLLGAAAYMISANDEARTTVAGMVERITPEFPDSVKQFPDQVRQQLPEMPSPTKNTPAE